MPKKISLKMPNSSDNKIKKTWIKEGKYDIEKNLNKNIVKTKRLTIDISQKLHTKLKVYCANKGVKMVDEVREILEKILN